MTATAELPVSAAGSTLAPYTAANGDIVVPGCYGVSHGSGITGELIRHATESWAGHAFVYVGNGQIIEAEPPAARVSAAASHPDAVWNVRSPLTDAQREISGTTVSIAYSTGLKQRTSPSPHESGLVAADAHAAHGHAAAYFRPAPG